MPHGGGRKRTTPRKAYAQKAAKASHGPKPFAKFPLRPKDEANNPFSMTDAARNTGHRGERGDKKLRHSHIAFVNAGQASNTEEEVRESTWSDAEYEVDQTNPHTTATQTQELGPSPHNSNLKQATVTKPPVPDQQAGALPSEPANSRATAENPIFFMDTTGDPSLQSTKPSGAGITTKGDEDDVDSDSSEEVVVFKGKNTGTTGRRGSPRRNAVMALDEDIATTKLQDETLTGAGIPLQSIPEPEVNLPPALSPGVTTEDAAVSDYIENLRAQGISEKELRDMGFLADPADMLDRLENEMESEAESADDGSDSDDDDSGNDDTLENELSNLDIDSEDEPPDEAQLGQAASAMTDEQIARRLAKQEELGLGSNEILLWADADMDGIVAEEEDELALDYLRDAASRMTGKSKRAKRRNKSLLPDMIDELDGGDDYGDFDAMDFDRPSLQRPSKKSKGLPFAVSDSELEATMIASWENDRSKKKQRKIERELLRAEGLLNGGSDSAQLRAKYAGGIGMTQIRDEIKAFLASGKKSLSLVAMDKQSRKAVHEIANRLNLRSKSKGDGLNRYPCLYRTAGTLEFDDVMADAIIRRYGAGKGGSFKFKGVRNMKPETGARRSRGGFGAVRDGASYRDGETVGAAAPALGAENRGHAMLAKMGWTMGTGLGALNNRGKLEPVPHVVKATRAGLG